MQTIDFNALKGGGWMTQPQDGKRQMIVLAIAMPATLLLLGIIAIVEPLLIAVVFMAGVTYAIWKLYRQNNQYKTAMRRFASDNGWTWGEEVPLNSTLSEMGLKFSRSLITGTLDGQRFWVHGVDAPYLKDDDLPSFDAVSVEFPKPLPLILIAPGGKLVSLLSNQIGKDLGLVPLHLEGDFPAKASAYCQKDQEAAALEYLTPDVMQVIADKATNVIIYAGHNMYISPNLFQDGGMLQSTFENAQLLAKEIKEKQHIN